MPTPAQIASETYARLKPGAFQSYQMYILTHTPADQQALVLPMIAADVAISNGQSVRVNSAAGTQVAGSPGAAEVAAGALTDVKLTV